MFEQAAIAVKDAQGYGKLQTLFNAAFDAHNVEVFLSRVIRAGLRVRDYEGLLGHGLLGKEAAGLYESLPVSDKALSRERFLQLVEAVPHDLRQRFFKAYASY